MSSSSSRISRATAINAVGIKLSDLDMAPCSNCRNAKVPEGEIRPSCVVGPRSKKCSECVRKNCRSCDVTLRAQEWQKLVISRDKLALQIEEIEKEELELMEAQDKLNSQLRQRREKKLRLRKIFAQQARRAEAAVEAELDVLSDEESGDGEPGSAVPVEAPVEIPEFHLDHGILELPIESWMALEGASSDFFAIPAAGVDSSSSS
ncbi:uncharacterized protein K489DRAFT_385632 [Dissoconium aciculare CBS 342.82]|uniref:Uncharacterized protein n=1 Tax=Dissoconium aciculare CBS 342.82 TaxID=1314786 RepID=A0A6J3LPW2_9PEZI|nr:uncharacterized protein K489DRAFT_385632 [Dissoconium aciculare CBS 342.82]KAF1817693.1 hypothetical protein K489DRAFT_385632 [Dissoconium aciculare CBS 342.82]